MRTLFVATAFAVIAAGASFAQGLPAGTTPRIYGANAFPNTRYQDHAVLSGRLRGSRADAVRTGDARQPVAGTGSTAGGPRL